MSTHESDERGSSSVPGDATQPLHHGQALRTKDPVYQFFLQHNALPQPEIAFPEDDETDIHESEQEDQQVDSPAERVTTGLRTPVPPSEEVPLAHVPDGTEESNDAMEEQAARPDFATPKPETGDGHAITPTAKSPDEPSLPPENENEAGKDLPDTQATPVREADQSHHSGFTKWLSSLTQPEIIFRAPQEDVTEDAGVNEPDESQAAPKQRKELPKKKKDTKRKKYKKKKKKKKAKKSAGKVKTAKSAPRVVLHEDIFSETLAELLAAQGHVDKAIEMYERMRLIYPEKSRLFAAKIHDLKKNK